MRPIYLLAAVVVATIVAGQSVAEDGDRPRRTMSLNGQWQITESDDVATVPDKAEFTHTVPVPGLIDLATPKFEKPGLSDRRNLKRLRACYWYRKTFAIDGEVPPVALLRLRKVKHGCSVYLNGQYVGDEWRSYTPLIFDVQNALKGNGAENELIVRVDLHRYGTDGRPFYTGDGEKARFIPGVYDSVDLILTGHPYIENVQVAPVIKGSSILIQTVLKNLTEKTVFVELKYVVREVATGKIVATHSPRSDDWVNEPRGHISVYGNCRKMKKAEIRIPNAKLWWPDAPFLYELEVTCLAAHPNKDDVKAVVDKRTIVTADRFATRFGMREFKFEDGIPVLNGKPTFLRGTNMCMHRFFEDPQRGTLPWDKEWVRKVIRGFKDMNWNSCRYCVGFPPEIWYEIADEEGLLIQDEFPIWHVHMWPEGLNSEKLYPAYRAWMHERWNHPSVVIWDAENETSNGIMDIVVARVRGEDMSDRPWQCGKPLLEKDISERHPYYMGGADPNTRNIRTLGAELDKLRKDARNGVLTKPPAGVSPRIINEYGWLWLRRNGDGTRLSTRVYDAFLGKDSTAQQRREFCARVLAMKTEKFRMQRNDSGVMHFCALTSSFPNCHTSDNYVDLQEATFEPHFYKYVRDSFAPTGLMVDLWEPAFAAGETFNVPVYLINDLYTDWSGTITISFNSDDSLISMKRVDAEVPTLLRDKVDIQFAAPKKPGRYEVIAALECCGKIVRSYRQITVK